MFAEEGCPSVVVDNGSYEMKAGLAGEEQPSVIFPTVVEDRRAISQCINWDDMEFLWHSTFEQKLQVNTEECKILLTEPPLNPKANREKMTQIMFETFNAPSMYISATSTLSLYASGRTSGLVINSGYSRTQISPIYEGYTFPHAVKQINVGGLQITKQLIKLLIEQNNDVEDFFKTNAGFSVAQNAKHSFCRVALNYTEESTSSNENSFDEVALPDGTILQLNQERIQCPEALFQPSTILDGNEDTNLPTLAAQSIRECAAMDCMRDLSAAIVLSGGNVLFPNIQQRLKSEMDTAFHIPTNIVCSPERQHAPFIGGSVLAGLSTFEEMWVTKEEYEDQGPAIVHRKCRG